MAKLEIAFSELMPCLGFSACLNVKFNMCVCFFSFLAMRALFNQKV